MARLGNLLAAASAIWLGITSVASGATVKGKPFPDLIDVTIDDLASGLSSGLFTSVDLVNAYVARIAQVNPILHAVLEVNPDALAIAADLDAKRAAGTTLGPLHGIPILLKDNIATADKMNNTAGSFALLGAKVPRDSTLVAKLRKAGAIILGKTNLSQWANYRSSNSSNGWTAIGGQTYGAYYPNMDPSGSSSGSGVSSSIGLALAALGSETSGSIVSPSQKGNLVGIKPTVGLTSRYLVIPISSHQDTVGPMARTVKDAAIILQAIAGRDRHDNYTSAIPFDCDKMPDYVAALDANGLAGARIGVPYNALSANGSPTEMAAFWAAVKTMQDAGATIVSANFTVPSPNTTSIVLGADFVSDLAAYLSELTYNPNNVHSLADVRAFTRSFPAEQFPDRNTATWDAALALGYNNTDVRFWNDLQRNYYFGGEGGMLGAIARNGLDALVMPTSQSAGRAAVVGAPIVTLPLGFYPGNWPVTRSSRGLVTSGPKVPFGLSFLGAKFSEETLLKLAYAYEQKTLTRVNGPKPYIVPNVEIGDFAGF
ncbi:amidase signature enzyme [Coniochaeta ligniaria NRRL 30616]|uniref:Amidase signature enzyme n=1 Tax=Coniochaeta ligniaria NRRL 30616 TaxID=1408157 RepID=A0A1J7JZ09_9PEZI|nr:amidase signature enzyme [Coniochaeta ligniaria NRRL 30616]